MNQAQAATPILAGARATARLRAPSAAHLTIAAACLIAAMLGGRALGDEGRTPAGGDAPRYLMNGVYFLDVLHDRPFGSIEQFVEYTELYYGRYPGLSLGHHPLLLSAAEVPAFALFGVSVSAARAVVAACFALTVLLTGLLVMRLFGPVSGALASLLLATSPHFIAFGQAVLSEMTGIVFVVSTAYFLHRFTETYARRDLVATTASIVLALYGKHLTLFALCGLAAYALWRLGLRRLLRRDVVVAAIVAAVCVSPLVPITVELSRSNISFIRGQVRGQVRRLTGTPAAPPRERHRPPIHSRVAQRVEDVRYALDSQFRLPVLLLVIAGAALALWRRDDGSMLLLCWVGGVLAGIVLVTGSLEPPRYTMYWVPALIGLAAALAAGIAWTRPRIAAVAALAGALALNVPVAADTEPKLTSGFEQAASFVVSQPRGATMLYSGEVDTGLFIFFVRKHDPGRSQIVLRADKVLTTSFMQSVNAEERISSPDQIYDVLRKFGTRYLIVEDRPTSARALNWLRDAVHTDRFVERYRVPFATTDPRLAGTSLAVYEYRDAGPPSGDAVLDMHLLLIGRKLDLKLSDLLGRRLLR